LAERARILDDRDPECFFAVSILAPMGGSHKRALATAQRAIDLNTNFAPGFLALGETRVFMGQFAEALDPLGRCLRLSPPEPFATFILGLIALAQYHLGKYDEAERYCEHALHMRRTYIVLRTMAAILGQMGKIEEAHAVLVEMDSLKPGNIRHWELTCPYANPSDEAQLIFARQAADFHRPLRILAVRKRQSLRCTTDVGSGSWAGQAIDALGTSVIPPQKLPMLLHRRDCLSRAKSEPEHVQHACGLKRPYSLRRRRRAREKGAGRVGRILAAT